MDMTAQTSLIRQFTDQVLSTVQEHNMIAPGHRVLIGLSGGPDSMALVQALMCLKKDLNIHLGLAHLNHMLRGRDALADESFVRKFARQTCLDLVVETRDVKTLARKEKRSIEEAGRNARYEFFNRTADRHQFDRVALGHNRDDHVEQILMNLVRGAGPRGLRGIPPTREERFIRPLITTPRSDIVAFLEQVSQDYVTDASNEDPAYLRNRVRHHLIPFLEKEFNPDIKTGLARLASIIALEDNFLNQMTQNALESVVADRQPGRIDLYAGKLADLDPALAARVIREGLFVVKKDLRRISHTHILDILTFARKKTSSGKSLDLPGQIRVYRQGDLLCIKKEITDLRTLGRQTKKSREATARQEQNLSI